MSDALSRVRNAARSVADDFLRFDRDVDRLRRAVEAAGGVTPDVMVAINQGCDTDARRRAIAVIHSRLVASADGGMQNESAR